MKATIADIRRGDRFIHAGRTYLAADDARPAIGLPADDSKVYSEIRTLPAKATASEDGYVHQRHYFVDSKAVRSTFEIDIIERDIPIILLWEEEHLGDPHPLTEPADKAARRSLASITAYRNAARRAADDADTTRDSVIRQSLQAGLSVAEIREITGLSRERIYQIRDGRR